MISFFNFEISFSAQATSNISFKLQNWKSESQGAKAAHLGARVMEPNIWGLATKREFYNGKWNFVEFLSPVKWDSIYLLWTPHLVLFPQNDFGHLLSAAETIFHLLIDTSLQGQKFAQILPNPGACFEKLVFEKESISSSILSFDSKKFTWILFPKEHVLKSLFLKKIEKYLHL